MLLYGCKAVGLLPRWLLYGCLRRVIYWIVYYVARYRVGVVRTNLRNAFPDREGEELRRIERTFYLHLAEIFVDTVDMASISRRAILKRIRVVGLEEHEAQVAGRDWIAAMSHYGSWEYFSAYQLLTPAQVAGVYHPLENEAFDSFYKRLRTRFGMETVSMKMLLRYIVRHRAEEAPRRNIAVGMIADQIPLPFGDPPWFEFLHQPTRFFGGVGEVAVRFGMPVYFLHLRKTGVARYEARFERIYDGSETVGPVEITGRYAALLQEDICREPAYWMWTHRRWKRPPAPGTNPEIHKLPDTACL